MVDMSANQTKPNQTKKIQPTNPVKATGRSNCFKVGVSQPALIWLIDWLIDFNGLSTCLGLFYAHRWGHRIQYMFIFAFCNYFLGVFFTNSYMISNIHISNNLHTVLWFQVFLSKINDYIDPSYYFFLIIHSVGWGCGIPRLHLCQ